MICMHTFYIFSFSNHLHICIQFMRVYESTSRAFFYAIFIRANFLIFERARVRAQLLYWGIAPFVLSLFAICTVYSLESSASSSSSLASLYPRLVFHLFCTLFYCATFYHHQRTFYIAFVLMFTKFYHRRFSTRNIYLLLNKWNNFCSEWLWMILIYDRIKTLCGNG